MSELEALCHELEASVQRLPSVAEAMSQRAAGLRALAGELEAASRRVRCGCGPDVGPTVRALHEAAAATTASGQALLAASKQSSSYVARTIGGGSSSHSEQDSDDKPSLADRAQWVGDAVIAGAEGVKLVADVFLGSPGLPPPSIHVETMDQRPAVVREADREAVERLKNGVEQLGDAYTIEREARDERYANERRRRVRPTTTSRTVEDD